MSPRPWPPAEPEPRRVGDDLDRLLARVADVPASTVAALFARWPDLVGADVAAHAWPVALRDGRLRLAVDDPAWGSQLRWLEADLLRRVRDALGGTPLQGIDVVVTGERAPGPAGAGRRGGPPRPAW